MHEPDEAGSRSGGGRGRRGAGGGAGGAAGQGGRPGGRGPRAGLGGRSNASGRADGGRDSRPGQPSRDGERPRARSGGVAPGVGARPARGGGGSARSNAPTTPRVVAPDVPEEVQARDLDRVARSRLRTLSKENADGVARHLVMAGRLLDEDPELAYAHAQAAVRRAGRVDVVREAAGITAYRTGRFAEALRELRTVRRLNGSDEHLPLMADCERGLGRPERAIALAQEDAARALPVELQVELGIVVSGARLDLGEPEAAVAVLEGPLFAAVTGEVAARVNEARAVALTAAGRPAEALAALGSAGATDEEADEVVVFDLEEADEAGAEDEVSPPSDPAGPVEREGL